MHEYSFTFNVLCFPYTITHTAATQQPASQLMPTHSKAFFAIASQSFQAELLSRLLQYANAYANNNNNNDDVDEDGDKR